MEKWGAQPCARSMGVTPPEAHSLCLVDPHNLTLWTHAVGQDDSVGLWEPDWPMAAFLPMWLLFFKCQEILL